jgi:hypothetical protein
MIPGCPVDDLLEDGDLDLTRVQNTRGEEIKEPTELGMTCLETEERGVTDVLSFDGLSLSGG